MQELLIGAAGAAAFEALKLWELQGKLEARKFRRLMWSFVFWGPFLMMVLASGFFAWAYWAGKTATPWDLVIAGIAARSLIRESIATAFAHAKPEETLGQPTESDVSLRDVFR